MLAEGTTSPACWPSPSGLKPLSAAMYLSHAIRAKNWRCDRSDLSDVTLAIGRCSRK